MEKVIINIIGQIIIGTSVVMMVKEIVPVWVFLILWVIGFGIYRLAL